MIIGIIIIILSTAALAIWLAFYTTRQEIKQNRWLPSINNKYYYIEATGSFFCPELIIYSTIWEGNKINLKHYNKGNCFKLKSKAMGVCIDL